MKINIRDYEGKNKTIDLGNKEIFVIVVMDFSGDEVLEVVYSDKTTASFDSSDNRMVNFFGGIYVLFDEELNDFLRKRIVE